MSSFTQPLIVKHLDDGKRWEVVGSFCYDVGKEGSGETICVPPGFITDFASIPRALWWLYLPSGRWGKAAVVHDLLYYLAGCAPPHGNGRTYDRRQADYIFLEGMKVLGVRLTARWTIYLSVRSCGWLTWRRRKRAFIDLKARDEMDKGQTEATSLVLVEEFAGQDRGPNRSSHGHQRRA